MVTVILLLGTIGFSYLLNGILLRYSRGFGVTSRQNLGQERWASTRKPTTGGISFFITFLVGFLIVTNAFPDDNLPQSRYLALIISSILAFLIGFFDDAYGTHPRVKFMGQLVCAAVLIFFDVHIRFFAVWSPYLLPLDYLLTAFWVVGIMNSLNMLDNMDGVTTTVALSITVVSMLMLVLREGLNNVFFILAATSGGFIGFMFWNWKPAKIYMGDTGSMFIGMLLAYLGIVYFWNIHATPDNISHVRKGLVPLLVFLMPIMDTTFVTVARIARGVSPFQGGKDHLTHNLVRLGVVEQMVPVAFGVITLISGGLAIFVYFLIPEWTAFYSVLFALYPIIVFALFSALYRRGTRIGKLRDLQKKREEARQVIEPESSPSEVSGSPATS